MDKLKDKMFWGMLFTPVFAAVIAFLSGHQTLQAAIGSGIAGVVAGLMGLFQPAPGSAPAKLEPPKA